MGSGSRELIERQRLIAHRIPYVLALLASICGTVTSWAQRPYDPPVAIERERNTFIVNSDGTYSLTMEESVRIRTEKGAKDNGSREVRYISSQEDIQSVEGWTVTADGTKIPVLPSAIRDREEDNWGGVSEFSDTKVMAIIFPRVEVGSLIAHKAVSRVHISPYPGEFSRSFVFPPSVPLGDWEAQFVLPESRMLYMDKRGVTGGLDKTVDSLSYYTFRYRREKGLAPQADAAGMIHYADSKVSG